ncbi:tetratricopeptide repeat protein [Dysgonomonas sp. 511]|uniref:tetratricopeptide repeat protein n=1 Tax=Dysgonomonas sp. 511 TaxID=2302930 RepID=UPI0013D8C2AC|nr:tetratricopeptide repeat protein [Dysgonomonas sp. 511]NDV79030.1 outer membrane protein assembly factor BamD [Dysgonomonas sp. 511]
MKKLFVALAVAISVQSGYAQKSAYTEMPDRLYSQGKEMYLDNNYVGAINTLEQFRQISKDEALIEEADFMIIASMYYRGNANAGDLLKDYLEKYPESYHRNQLTFFIGSFHFAEKDWKRALYWLADSDIDYLNEKEQADCSYRMAYSFLQTGNRAEAKRLFGLLTKNSKEYLDPASFYLAYTHFQDGEYEQAIPTFTDLKNRKEYREDATFYLMQSNFLQGDIDATIDEARDYLMSYPNSRNTAEVYRLLGNSYYRKGNMDGAIDAYQNYVYRESSPNREDMYQLADAYYRKQMYDNAIENLNGVATTGDVVGQAGNMLLGLSYLKINDHQNAATAFDAAASVTYDRSISEKALYNYVILANRSGSSAFNEAVSAAQRFFNEYPSSQYTNDVSNALANTLLSSKNYDAALSAINSLTNPGKQILTVKQVVLYQIGVQEYIDGRYDNANRQLNAAITMGEYDSQARKEAYFWRGETAYRRGNYSSAASDYNTYISQSTSKQANYSLALYNLGYAYFQSKNYSNALTNFRKYISAESNRKSPNYTDALNRIGDCYLQSRNFSQAENYYSQAANTSPQSADYAEYQKAFVLGMQRNYNGKIATLNNMMSRYPNSEYYDDALFEKSRALVMLGNESEAITVLEQLLRERPKSDLAPKAGIQLGQLYFNANNHQKAITAYKNVIEAAPNTEEARTAIQSLEGVYRDINDISAYASYANSLGKGTVISASRQDSLTYQAASDIYMKGKKSEARTALQKYLQTYPRGVFSSDARFYLGTIAFDMKDYDTAQGYFKEVVKSNNPKYLEKSLIIVSDIEYNKQDYQSAYATYEQLNKVATSNENRAIAQLGMLRCANLMKKDSEVVAAATKILQGTNTAAVTEEARFYRGKSLYNMGQNSKAVADLEQVAKSSKTEVGAESKYLLAEIYYQTKNYAKAENHIKAFLSSNPSNQYWAARSIIVLSDVYAAQGKNTAARDYLTGLQMNYKGSEADIREMVSSRLTKLK